MAKTFMGVRLRSLRAERGMTQAALAQALELSPSYLNQIERTRPHGRAAQDHKVRCGHPQFSEAKSRLLRNARWPWRRCPATGAVPC